MVCVSFTQTQFFLLVDRRHKVIDPGYFHPILFSYNIIASCGFELSLINVWGNSLLIIRIIELAGIQLEEAMCPFPCACVCVF